MLDSDYSDKQRIYLSQIRELNKVSSGGPGGMEQFHVFIEHAADIIKGGSYGTVDTDRQW